jgi:hypothetical protein
MSNLKIWVFTSYVEDKHLLSKLRRLCGTKGFFFFKTLYHWTTAVALNISSFHVTRGIMNFHSKVQKEGYRHTPVIILTLTPRSKALLIVSALSWRGGSKSGRRPTNSQGPPGLSLVPAGTS